MNYQYKLCLLIVLKGIIISSNPGTLEDYDKILENIYQYKQNDLSQIVQNIDVNPLINIECLNPTTKVIHWITNINDDNIAQKLDISKNIGFIIHGWNDDFNRNWIVELASEWRRFRDENVCRVDWSSYAKVNYIAAVAINAQIVAGYLSEIIKDLNKKYSVPFRNFILVGHSLGAHVCGYIGANCNGQIGMIFGLDPAGPLFSVPFVVPIENRLDLSDAELVQIIHTSDGAFGIGIASGHQDFYINNGVFPQRGCVFPFLVNAIKADPIGCSHLRAVQFFIDSISNNGKCLAVKCDNAGDFLQRQCSNVYDVMGFLTRRNPGQFYLNSGNAPVCSGNLY